MYKETLQLVQTLHTIFKVTCLRYSELWLSEKPTTFKPLNIYQVAGRLLTVVVGYMQQTPRITAPRFLQVTQHYENAI